jgi:hypothetical protein
MPPRVCSRGEEVLRDQFRLAGWVQKPRSRREQYFAWCDRATRDLRVLSGGISPRHESIVITLVAALGEDESFAGHAQRRGGTFLTEDGNWDKLHRAGAATILEEYLDAVEQGKWP